MQSKTRLLLSFVCVMLLVGVGMASIEGGPAQLILGVGSSGDFQFVNTGGNNVTVAIAGFDCGKGGSNCIEGYGYYGATVGTYDLWMTGGPPTLGAPVGSVYPVIMNGSSVGFSWSGGGYNLAGDVTFNTIASSGYTDLFNATMLITSSTLPGYTAGDYALMDFTVNLGSNPSLDAVYQGQVGSTEGYLSSGEAAPVPEPSSMLLFGSGMVGIAGLLRRKLNF